MKKDKPKSESKQQDRKVVYCDQCWDFHYWKDGEYDFSDVPDIENNRRGKI